MTVAKSDAQKRAEKKYKREKYTNINLTLKPDAKAAIQKAAAAAAEPTNTYIKKAVAARMQTEGHDTEGLFSRVAQKEG